MRTLHLYNTIHAPLFYASPFGYAVGDFQLNHQVNLL